jgi:DNA-binding NarL/FixJ family response regulator
MATSFSTLDSIRTPATEAEIQQAAAKTSTTVQAAPPAPGPTSTTEDTVTISAPNEQTAEPANAQVLQEVRQVQQLSEHGQSVQQIASALQITPQSVTSYLEIPTGAAPAPATDAKA